MYRDDQPRLRGASPHFWQDTIHSKRFMDDHLSPASATNQTNGSPKTPTCGRRMEPVGPPLLSTNEAAGELKEASRCEPGAATVVDVTAARTERTAPTGLGDEVSSAFQRFGPAVIFQVITISMGADFADDVVSGEASALHLTGMAFGTVLSFTGLVMMLRILSRSRARAQELATALDRTRVDSIRWREQAGQMLAGVGSLIDKQFEEWDLSPSEREVGMLLLKGLSLKDIAALRKTSEPTVRQQAQAIYRKAGLTGRVELSAFFLEDLLLPRRSGAASSSPTIAPTRARA